MQLDHVTMRCRDLATTRDFFVRIFGLKEGLRPRAIRRIPGCWLYAEDAPIVHLIGARGAGNSPAPEDWDHVGFRLTGYAAFREKLVREGISFSPMDLPELGERRLFLFAPGGQLIETVFREE